MILPILQQLTFINGVLYYAPKIFESFKNQKTILTFATNAMNFLFTIVSVFLSDKLGRRLLMIIGSIICAITLSACAITYFKESICFLSFRGLQ